MERLREIRIRRGLSQDNLSELTGVSQKAISDIEVGRVEPRPSTLRKLARGLGVEVSDLFVEPLVPLGSPPETVLERLRAVHPRQLRRLIAGGYGPDWSVGGIVEAKAVADELGVTYEELKGLLIQVSPLQARRLLVAPEESRSARDEALGLYTELQRGAVEQGRLTEAEMGHNIGIFTAA